MAGFDWTEVSKKMNDEIKSVGKIIKNYDYSTEAKAESTDVKICEFVIEEIRRAKDILFNIINTAYELHEERLNKNFEGLRDDLDVFSDEIKIRNFVWNNDITAEWVERMVRYDFELISHMNKLNTELEEAYKLFMKVVKTYPDKTDPNHIEGIRELTRLIEKLVDHIVITFKEREVISNLQPIDLEKTFQQMQDYYRRLI